jgi:hypothetical protein
MVISLLAESAPLPLDTGSIAGQCACLFNVSSTECNLFRFQCVFIKRLRVGCSKYKTFCLLSYYIYEVQLKVYEQ